MGGRPLAWLRERHSLREEAFVVVLMYALYETSRGLVAGNPGPALDHARRIASLERSLHIFVEGNVQHAARDLPGLVGTLGVLYLTMHLSVTGLTLLWLHRRRPAAFPHVRTAFLVASGLALAGYLAFPTAPPRLAGIGIADTISGGDVDLNHGLISSLYNPFAAFPSVHIAYASIVAVALIRFGGSSAARAVGALYPAVVLLVIVATGNHFLVDAAGGATVAAIAIATTALMLGSTSWLKSSRQANPSGTSATAC